MGDDREISSCRVGLDGTCTVWLNIELLNAHYGSPFYSSLRNGLHSAKLWVGLIHSAVRDP